MEKHLLFHEMFYYSNSHFLDWLCICPHNLDSDRIFEWRQHKQTWRRGNERFWYEKIDMDQKTILGKLCRGTYITTQLTFFFFYHFHKYHVKQHVEGLQMSLNTISTPNVARCFCLKQTIRQKLTKVAGDPAAVVEPTSAKTWLRNGLSNKSKQVVIWMFNDLRGGNYILVTSHCPVWDLHLLSTSVCMITCNKNDRKCFVMSKACT